MSCVIVNVGRQKSLNDLLPAVLRSMRGIPPHVALPELRDALITFCKRSEVLRAISVIDLQSGVSGYRICPPAGYQVIHATCVLEDGNRIVIRPELCSCTCGDFFMSGPDFIELLQAPYFTDEDTVPHQLTIEYVVAPARDGVVIDEVIYNQFRDGIVAGALAALMLLPDTKWYNPSLSAVQNGVFRRSITDARIAIAKNFSNANMRMKPVRFV